jgi:hypothetical protein
MLLLLLLTQVLLLLLLLLLPLAQPCRGSPAGCPATRCKAAGWPLLLLLLLLLLFVRQSKLITAPPNKC